MYPNIPYALLSAALIVLSMVHLILLTVHRPQPHRLPEISIFVLFICVNAVVIGIGLSGLRRGDTPAFYYPLGICTAFPLALEMIRLSKIQAGPLTNALLHRLFLGSVAYEASVKGTAVIVSIDYTVLAIAGLLFWRGIRGIPSQGPVIREITIHAFLVFITAGFAAGGLVHDWPFWIEVMLIITIGAYMARNISAQSLEPGNAVPLANFTDDTSDLGQLSPHQESRSARLPFMTEESYTRLDEVRTARPESAHLKIRAVASIYYPDRPILETGIFTVLCEGSEGSEGDYRRDLRYDELTACSDGEAAIQSYRLGSPSLGVFLFDFSLATLNSFSYFRLNKIPILRSLSCGWMLLLHKTGEPLSTQTVTLGTAASKVILVLREMDKDLTSDPKIRKRASTRAMRENAEPNKRTDRSQDQNDDQITAHDLLNKIRGKSQTRQGYVRKAVRRRLRLFCCRCEEDVSGGGECRQCGHTSCPECLHERTLRRERSVDRSHEPNQANRRHDAQTNNQTSAVPATHLSQAIEIDEDPETETASVLYMLPYPELALKLEREREKRETWVNRAIKCCYCEGTGSAVNKCACGHDSGWAKRRISALNIPKEPNSLGARQSTTCSTRQRRYHDRNFTGCSTCKARHVKCDEAAPACRSCIKRGLHCDGAQNEILYKFVDPSQGASSFVKRQHKGFRRETAKNHGVSSSHPLPYKDPTSSCLRSVDLQSGIHASTESLAMDNPTIGVSPSDGPYLIDKADRYYPDIRGDTKMYPWLS
ncbi:predicted protein [Histoplasma mississippiense (nom. inval.)]|uniref:predicted protein n=1 Tax=Ajellomyces capsulatus (strain NAm1 / WU24) TaxID=2059318 RepID=UPI000157C4A2|nr:predicted protein [Histoplasma mississippiense (nom. inval.)]EDN08213.1 predicted protein [Histoplasma mississippiense (nom. inval.)]